MKKILLSAVVAAAGGWLLGSIHAQPTPTNPPVVVKSANDPTKPVPGGVRWFGRMHASYVEQTKNKKFDLCLLGDSVTQMWPGDLFVKYFGYFNAVNFGIGGDRAENVLWRLQHGELDGTSPKLIVLLIGTNNSGMNTPDEIALGVATVLQNLRTKLPKTKILLLGILPRRDANRAKTDAANPLIAKLGDGKMVHYHDLGGMLLDKEGKLLPGMLTDDVHLSRKAYEAWGEAITPFITKLMAE
jgi:beta-glucosidase